MGEARDLMDRATDGAMARDHNGLRACYAEDATLVSPDAGEISGLEGIAEYLLALTGAFPDASWEPIAKHETADTAIDEGYFSGTNTEPLQLSPAETIPATGSGYGCGNATSRP